MSAGVPLGNFQRYANRRIVCDHEPTSYIDFGVGVVDVLPGIDLDMMAGGMLRTRTKLGAFTTTSIESYWIGFGLTWRFGRGAVTAFRA